MQMDRPEGETVDCFEKLTSRKAVRTVRFFTCLPAYEYVYTLCRCEYDMAVCLLGMSRGEVLKIALILGSRVEKGKEERRGMKLYLIFN